MKHGLDLGRVSGIGEGFQEGWGWHEERISEGEAQDLGV